MRIGANSDYKHSDYHFPRVQSRKMSNAAWDRTEPAWKSWRDGILVLLFMIVVCGALWVR